VPVVTNMNEINVCCADCGSEAGEGVSLKACKSCMRVRYCNAKCQRNHWSKHKNYCKLRAAERHDEALFKDPPAKEDCAICFLPMPTNIISCMSLPPATILSVPIKDFAIAHDMLANMATEVYYECCGKSICVGCIHSFGTSGNMGKCPFCNSERMGKTDEENIQELFNRVEVNDAGAMTALGCYYSNGHLGLSQDGKKAIELWKQAAELGSSKAHFQLGTFNDEGGDLKKAKFHYEAAAMAGHEGARYNLGCMEAESGNMGRAVKHWMIAASAGCFHAMDNLLIALEDREVSRESIDSILTAYNKSCAEMRSEARDAFIRIRSNQ
jgi:TPR repeat protein